jgi:hypothetical protein
LAVVEWFAEAGLALPSAEPVPDPPDDAVHTAIVWVFERNRRHQLIRIARSAATEAERDAFYTAAEQFVRPGVCRMARSLN